MRSEIDDFIAELLEKSLELFLHLETAMVGANGNPANPADTLQLQTSLTRCIDGERRDNRFLRDANGLAHGNAFQVVVSDERFSSQLDHRSEMITDDRYEELRGKKA